MCMRPFPPLDCIPSGQDGILNLAPIMEPTTCSHFITSIGLKAEVQESERPGLSIPWQVNSLSVDAQFVNWSQ